MRTRFTLTAALADTIVRVHQNGMFEINCRDWEKLYQSARVVLAKQKVQDAEDTLTEELEKLDA